MKTINENPTAKPRGLIRMRFELKHQARNANNANAQDPLKGSAPGMKPMAAFSRVTGLQAAKYAAASLYGNESGSAFQDMKYEDPFLPSRTSTTGHNIGKAGREYLAKGWDNKERVLGTGGLAAVGGLLGYGAGKLTGIDPRITTLLGTLAGGYGGYKMPLPPKTASARREALEAVTEKEASFGDPKEALVRLAVAEAGIAESDKRAIIDAVTRMSDGQASSILARLGPGLMGGGLVAALLSLILGKKAAIPGAALGYLAGNLLGGGPKPRGDFDIYGRPAVV